MLHLFIFSSLILNIYPLSLSALNRREGISCNGSPEWCPLKFDQYTFLGTHNSQGYNLKVECTDKKDFLYQLACGAIQAIPAIDDCLYNNQFGNSISKQLEDGIRAFDVDTGMLGGVLKVCHGNNDYTAYGEKLTNVLESFKTFLQRNPGEVLVLEFGDTKGDVKAVGEALVKEISASLGDYLFQRSSDKDPWPTLGDMIKSGKRVVVFISPGVYGKIKPPAWALNKERYYAGAWSFTHKFDDPAKISSSIRDFCDNTKDNRWLGCDFEFSIDLSFLKNTLLKQKPKLCIADAAAVINPSILNTVTHCFGKKALHRIRTDDYKKAGDLRKIVDEINKKNAGKFIFGSSATL